MADSQDTTLLPELTRPMIEAEIERLIARLDDMDPDPDLEDGGDGEPMLGAPEAHRGSWSGLFPEAYQDDREADDGDDEPSLAAPEASRETRWAQTHWAAGRSDELEEVCEDEGAQCEDEGAFEYEAELDEDHGPYIKWQPHSRAQWEAEVRHQERTTKACQAGIANLQAVQRRHSKAPVRSLRVLGGATVKG
ncbi:MAG: hypothetical protein HY245_03990 [Rhizobiales bacterium]|nr:hypothetical protein [Hyphomicrobiales bacterium]MBI3672583.1 hypothetical protein [Hyphomicrobiales bacterium]